MNENQPGDSLRNQDVEVPRRAAVSSRPAIFDTRNQAWRIYFPETAEARDPRHNPNVAPRQRALTSCNLLELFERLRTCLGFFQCEFEPTAQPNVIRMPFAFIEPRPGWVLRNLTTERQHKVAQVGRLARQDGVFDGTVVLEGDSGPSPGDALEWLDPHGALDGQPKLVELLDWDQVGSALEPEEESGDVADVHGEPFLPKVSMRLYAQQPGSRSKTPFGGMREIKPVVRETLPDPADPRQGIEIKGWWMDTLVEFNCYSINGATSDRLAQWFSHFLSTYNGVLKALGVQEMLFWESKPARVEGRQARRLCIRPLHWYFRLEDLYVSTMSRIKTLNVVGRVQQRELGLFEGEIADPSTSNDQFGSFEVAGS